MTVALAIQTEMNRFLLSVTLPAYRPSSLLLLIVALMLALAGLVIDPLLIPSGPVGTVALWPAIAALGMVLGLLALEVRNYDPI